MKIVVKISDIEVQVERDVKTDNDSDRTKISINLKSVKELLNDCVEKAKELYNNRFEQLDK